jgi:hypothetical protein
VAARARRGSGEDGERKREGDRVTGRRWGGDRDGRGRENEGERGRGGERERGREEERGKRGIHLRDVVWLRGRAGSRALDLFCGHPSGLRRRSRALDLFCGRRGGVHGGGAGEF